MAIGIVTRIIALAIVVNAKTGRYSPPEIWDPQGNKWPETRVYVRKNDIRTFACKAKGNPTPTYAWYKDGKDVSNVRDVVSIDKVSGNFTALKYFHLRNSGYYQCRATNSHGTSMTPPIYISATDAETFSGSSGGDMTTEVTAITSTYLKLICEDIPSSIPPYTVHWKRENYGASGRSSGKSDVELNDRLVVDPDGHLHFLWVEQTDNDVIYVCAVKNDVIRIEMTNTKQTKIKVTSGITQARSPELKYNSSVTAMVGDDAHLTCIFSYFSNSSQQLEINWFLRGDEVGQGSTLIIRNIQVPTDTVNQEGTYLCEARLGEQTERGWVDLKITAPPQFQPGMEPTSYTVPEGNDAVFYCNTTSHNSYSSPPMWMMNGNPIVGCPMMPIEHFECTERKRSTYSICIPLSQRCDGSPDCDPASGLTSSDEQNCTKVTCTEPNTHACGDKCIPVSQTCVPLVCDYPNVLCSDAATCVPKEKVCDGVKNCGDGADENVCPGRAPVTVGRFSITSDRAMLTLPSVRLTDTMCVQCSVSNGNGVAFGDACLSIIDRIVVLLRPKPTYHVTPGSSLTIDVDAHTDPMWQSQLKYQWFWYREVKAQGTQEKTLVKTELPPKDGFGPYFMLSQTGKNLTITMATVEKDTKNSRDIYTAMTKGGQMYSVKIGHRYDSVEMNFTITGTDIVPQDQTESPVDDDRKPTTARQGRDRVTTGERSIAATNHGVWTLPVYIGIILLVSV